MLFSLSFEKINFHKLKNKGFVQNKVSHVYHLNVLNKLIFMHKVKTETAPAVYLLKF